MKLYYPAPPPERTLTNNMKLQLWQSEKGAANRKCASVHIKEEDVVMDLQYFQILFLGPKAVQL